MMIRVTKKHIRLGKPEKGQCPLSLAFQDSLDLPERLIYVSPLCLTLLNYNSITVYNSQMPEVARDFYKKYFDYFFNIEKFYRFPKPVSFEMGVVDYMEAGKWDQLENICNKIKEWG